MAEKILNQDIALAFVRDPEYLDNLLYVDTVDNFYLYNGKYHKQLSYKLLSKLVHTFVREKFDVNIKMSFIKDIIEQMTIVCHRSIEEIDTPYIALSDKLLNTTTFEFEGFDINKIAINEITVTSEEVINAQPSTVFEEYITSSLVTKEQQQDPELVSLVQQMFGYYLTNTLKEPAVFFLVGQGANGKSIMLQLLTSLIGNEACCSKSIQTLTTSNWAVAQLVGMKLNVCNEEESKFLKADKFKALVSGDPIEGDRKFLGTIRFSPKTKYIFASNEMPSFEGINVGLKRRIKIVPFYRIFKDYEQDKNLFEKLKKDLPAILKWSMIGGKKFIDNGYRFSESKALQDTMEEFEQGVSAALRFFAEGFVVDNDERFTKSDLYKEYLLWIVTNGRNKMNSANFHKDIGTIVRGIKEVYVKIDNVTHRAYNIRRRRNDELPKPEEEFLTLPSDLDVNQLPFINPPQ